MVNNEEGRREKMKRQKKVIVRRGLADGRWGFPWGLAHMGA